MYTKQAILVAGYDMNREGIDFSRMCPYRMDMIRKKFPKEKIRFTVFDVGKGTVKWYEPDEKTGKIVISDAMKTSIITNPDYNPVTDPRDTVESKVPYKFDSVNDKNYTDESGKVGYAFIANTEKVMSITDMYTHIQDIGNSRDAGTLLEFSFFAHGFEGGPVLVNYWETYGKTSDQREPPDKDPRYLKDYKASVMNAKQLENFKKAFDKNGICWSWGCSFPYGYNTILGTIFKTPKYKTKAIVPDNEKFELKFEFDKNRDEAERNYAAIKEILSKYGKEDEKKRVFQVSFTMKDIKDVFRKALEDSWGTATTRGTGLNTYAAFTGTYADPFGGVMGVMQSKDQAAWTKAEQTMHERNPRHKVEPFHYFDQTIKFYINYLGRTKDPENRGYGVFTP